MKRLVRKRSTVWDWLLYVGIGLAILAAAAVYVVATSGKAEFPVKWFGLTLATPIIFSILIRGS